MTDTQKDEKPEMIFICPNDGEISIDNVAFLCNHCKQEDVVLQDGLYLCPACLMPGENFECMLCESREVKMVKKEAKS